VTALARLLRATGLTWSAGTVAKVETGRRGVSAGELVALGIALGRSPVELLELDGPVRLGASPAWVPSEAVTTWAGGADPDEGQRGRWAEAESAGAAPVHRLTDDARRLAAYLGHRRRSSAAVVSRRDLVQDTCWVADALRAWAEAEQAAGRTVTPHARRAKEHRLWRELASGGRRP
jgi:hypothetical protein